MKIVIVGAGLFGSIATTLCRLAGHQVTLIDNNSPLAASPCAGNFFKPSWLTAMAPKAVELALNTLDTLYKVETVECVVCPERKRSVQLQWVNPRSVLLKPDVEDVAAHLGYGEVLCSSGVPYTGKVLIAAGIGCASLVNLPPMKALMGACLRVNTQLKTSAIQMYAPYKHAIAHNFGPSEVWAGDGAAIQQERWDYPTRVDLLKMRARVLGVSMRAENTVRTGARPSVEGFKAGYFKKVMPNTWVSTGGAKNGLVLAAYQAQLFLEAIGG